MVAALSEEGLRALCTLLKEYLLESYKDIVERRHQSIILPALAYIPDVTTPTLECASDGMAIVVDCPVLRFTQRLAATKRFYGSQRGRFDSVLVIEKDLCEVPSSKKKKMCCWFEKVLCLVQINQKSTCQKDI